MERSTTPLTGIKPGGHQLRGEVVVQHQRRRILDATVELVAESGYRALTVGAIIKRAGVAKLKFYELFSSKADAFLAALDEAIDGVGERVSAACEAAGDSLPERLDAGLGAALGFCAERPELTRAVVLEAPALGPEAAGRGEAAVAAFAPLFEGKIGPRRTRRPPPGWEEGVLDGLYWLLYEAVLSGRPKRLGKLRPAMVEFALLPLLGPGATASA
ncbi:MAG TPA: TetR/AcrR family transcriptional regulator [Solirubrobacterales bacterium]|nr:TetR/AcrR family transcriptional regulator [Solirubrobacterales bacterium]